MGRLFHQCLLFATDPVTPHAMDAAHVALMVKDAASRTSELAEPWGIPPHQCKQSILAYGLQLPSSPAAWSD